MQSKYHLSSAIRAAVRATNNSVDKAQAYEPNVKLRKVTNCQNVTQAFSHDFQSYV